MINWFNFATYAIAATYSPGPNNIMSMSNASLVGFKKSFPFNLGIWCGFSILMVLCTIFCNGVMDLIPKIKTPMLILGAAYMLYLAWKTITRSTMIEEKNSNSGFIAGTLLQFINPKIYIYSIVSMEAYVLPVYQGQMGKLILCALVLAFIGFTGTVCWAVFGSAFKVLFSKYGRITNTVMALLLVYCAVSLFI